MTAIYPLGRFKYIPSQNKFYQRYNEDGSIDRACQKAIRAVDIYYISLNSQKGLLDRYTSPKLYKQTEIGIFFSHRAR